MAPSRVLLFFQPNVPEFSFLELGYFRITVNVSDQVWVWSLPNQPPGAEGRGLPAVAQVIPSLS